MAPTRKGAGVVKVLIETLTEGYNVVVNPGLAEQRIARTSLTDALVTAAHALGRRVVVELAAPLPSAPPQTDPTKWGPSADPAEDDTGELYTQGPRVCPTGGCED